MRHAYLADTQGQEGYKIAMLRTLEEHLVFRS